ncbi:MAG: hypothetical protein SD837_03090 [Candidatus Electrothrix scaldis]|nr:MAG: hypothetical protein SD837_03090 [Candidatus Electrothrix sp. GW3-3]
MTTNFSPFNMGSEKLSEIDFAQKNDSRNYRELKIPQTAKKISEWGDLKLETEDYELASEYFNKARRSGIQGSNRDFLICAISTRNNMPILTTDKDFENFQSVLPVTLHEVKK